MRRTFMGLLAFALVLGLLAAAPVQAKVYKMSPEERAAALKEKRAKRTKAKKSGKAAPGQDQGGWVEVKPGERIAKKNRMSKVDEIAKAAEKKGEKSGKKSKKKSKAEADQAVAEKPAKAEKTSKKSKRSKKNAEEAAPEKAEKAEKGEKTAKAEKAEKSGKSGKSSKSGKAEKAEKAETSEKAEKPGKKSKRSKKADEGVDEGTAKPAKSEKADRKSRKSKQDGGEEIVVEKKGYKAKSKAEKTEKAEKGEQAASQVEKEDKADKSGRGRKSSRKSRHSATQGDRAVGAGVIDERKVPASSTEVHRTVIPPAFPPVPPLPRARPVRPTPRARARTRPWPPRRFASRCSRAPSKPRAPWAPKAAPRPERAASSFEGVPASGSLQGRVSSRGDPAFFAFCRPWRKAARPFARASGLTLVPCGTIIRPCKPNTSSTSFPACAAAPTSTSQRN